MLQLIESEVGCAEDGSGEIADTEYIRAVLFRMAGMMLND